MTLAGCSGDDGATGDGDGDGDGSGELSSLEACVANCESFVGDTTCFTTHDDCNGYCSGLNQEAIGYSCEDEWAASMRCQEPLTCDQDGDQCLGLAQAYLDCTCATDPDPLFCN